MKTVTVTVPPPAAGSSKTWRKILTGVDPTKDKGYALIGDWLDAGAGYAMSTGLLVVGYDRVEGTGHVVTVWLTGDEGELTAVKTITRKGPWAGPATIKAMAKLVDKHPRPTGAITRRVMDAVNTVAGECARCRGNVKAGEGVQARNARGYLQVLHKQCPPRRNTYAGPCVDCGGWLAAGEGVLIQAIGTAETGKSWITRHEGQCPPPAERKPAPPRTNDRDGQCGHCWQTVPAGTGHYRDRQVWHDGDCPAYPGGYTGPTWQIGYGRPGPFRPMPARGYQNGQVLRATLYGGPDVPADTPGYRITGRHVSAIVVVVAEGQPVYCRDEDGNNPADLVGEDGWYFQARVRPATADEAADLLAAEAARKRRTELAEQARREFVTGDNVTDATMPPADEVPDLLNLPGVRIEPAHVGLAFAASYGAYIHLRVDADSGVVWTLRYNGADGDDWAHSNYRSYIARRMPYTAERRSLVEALAAEFGTIPAESAPQ